MRSGLELVEEPKGFDAALEGLPELFVCGLPKKSKPSNESPGFVVLPDAGATGALGTGLELGISAVFGLIGGAGVSSPNKSMVGTGCLVGGGGG